MLFLCLLVHWVNCVLKQSCKDLPKSSVRKEWAIKQQWTNLPVLAQPSGHQPSTWRVYLLFLVPGRHFKEVQLKKPPTFLKRKHPERGGGKSEKKDEGNLWDWRSHTTRVRWPGSHPKHWLGVVVEKNYCCHKHTITPRTKQQPEVTAAHVCGSCAWHLAALLRLWAGERTARYSINK